MNFKEVIGQRIRLTRKARNWTLEELARRTGDVLSLKRINAYENGDRMPGPDEAVILAKSLGVRPAYILAVDDIQIAITQQEETLVRNWRTLNERDRMDMYRKIQALALQNRDPATDDKVERAFPVPKQQPAKGKDAA